MSIEKIRRLNPDKKIFAVTDAEFSEYGKILEKIDTDGIIKAANDIKMPENGSIYRPSEPTFEALPIAGQIKEQIFGTLDSQLGFCCGYSSMLNASEWHSSSELNIAVTPLVLILGKRSDIKDGKLDSSAMKIFYLDAGTVIEVYAATLHFCPCQTENTGFRCVVGLPTGTNTPLDGEVADKRLFRKNKWLIAHVENKALIDRGAVAGITGENYKINF